ncbi:MAG: FHA domain-containing protein [Lachnospiraceae bacterium]|nr:FHA domain-containing protein [Lachnospiraceae bacterium]
MNLIKCPNQHFYDADKFVTCPHCENEAAGVRIADLMGQQQKDKDTAIPDDPESVSRPKTTGWLVCTSGIMRGESFILREGVNHIGRASHMDIRLSREPSVSREDHAVITYDATDHTFILSSAAHADRVWYNQMPLTGAQPLTTGDCICLSDCTLLFVALCNDSFAWD